MQIIHEQRPAAKWKQFNTDVGMPGFTTIYSKW